MLVFSKGKKSTSEHLHIHTHKRKKFHAFIYEFPISFLKKKKNTYIIYAFPKISFIYALSKKKKKFMHSNIHHICIFLKSKKKFKISYIHRCIS